MDERNAPLPPLVKSQNLMSKYPGAHELPTAELRTDDGMVKIRPVQNDAEALEFEKMCRQSADDCESFGIDEFDEEGHFNRKLFRSSNIVLAEQASSGDIVGASIIGPAKLTRTPVSLLAHQYIIAKKGQNQSSVGEALINYGLSSIKQLGYKGVLSDIYPTNTYQVHLYNDFNFTFRGSLPYAGYLKGLGPSPSLLVYLRV